MENEFEFANDMMWCTLHQAFLSMGLLGLIWNVIDERHLTGRIMDVSVMQDADGWPKWRQHHYNLVIQQRIFSIWILMLASTRNYVSHLVVAVATIAQLRLAQLRNCQSNGQ